MATAFRKRVGIRNFVALIVLALAVCLSPAAVGHSGFAQQAQGHSVSQDLTLAGIAIGETRVAVRERKVAAREEFGKPTTPMIADGGSVAQGNHRTESVVITGNGEPIATTKRGRNRDVTRSYLCRHLQKVGVKVTGSLDMNGISCSGAPKNCSSSFAE